MPSPNALEQARSIVVPELERDTLRVRGSDAKSWLNGVLSCDVSQLSKARGVYGLLLNKQGKIQAELDLIEAEGSLLLGVSAGRGALVQAQLDRVLVMEDAEISAEPDLRWLRFYGPDAGIGARAVVGSLGSGELDWLGLGGVSVVVRDVEVEAALQAAVTAGAQRVSTELWNVLRIRRGFPSYGSDFSDEDNPHEASLERRAVSWTKGCYLGQEVVCMQDMRGRVKRRLVALELDGDVAVSPESEVESPGEAGPVGRITSSASDGVAAVALARLKFPFFEGKHTLVVAGRNARILAPTAPGDGSLKI
jgi:folate-binding protein YgfZ